jgi:type II secretory pathway predicted ATPase ExeA
MVSRRRPSSELTAEPQLGPFPYADYTEARRGLRAALAGPSFYALLSGASGMGKTCLLRELCAELDRHRYHVFYVSSSRASLVGVVRFVAQKLHVTPRRSYIETVDVLAEAIAAQTAHLLLWIDEAHEVEPAALQELRMLAESSLGLVQLFSVVLSGLPPLLSLLDAPALFPLKRRITLRWTLAGLRRDELDPFLGHRFGTADAERVPLAVRDELFERTQATPALLDRVVRQALRTTEGQLDPEHIRAALDLAGL